MEFSKEDQEKRKKAMQEQAKLKELRKAQGEYAFQQAEKEAFKAGKQKSGGFLGFGGTYSGKSKESFATGGAKMTGEKGASGGSNASKFAAAGEMASSMMGSGGGAEGGAPASDSEGALGGAAKGASMGAAFGPWGAAVGAVVGAVKGISDASAARSAAKAKIEAQKQQAIGAIEEEKGKQLSAAIGQMGQRMSLR